MNDAKTYAEEIWGAVNLGDQRLTRRAVAALTTVAARPGASFVDACRGDLASQERLYRFVRARNNNLDALIDAGCSAMAQYAARQCQGDIAVVGDTTSFSFRHKVRAELGRIGSKNEGFRRGFFSHVALAVDAERGTVLGPLDLDLAIRQLRDPEQPRDHKKIRYEEKESFKWEASSDVVDERTAEFRHRLIRVNDREADVLEYLMSLIGADLRFVVRASWDRILADGERLRAKLAPTAPSARVSVRIEQKGGRPARNAVLDVRSAPICLDGRAKCNVVFPRLTMNAVWLTETAPPAGATAVDWLLLTSEPIEEVEQTLYAVRLYCLRWLVEEYNKCCKSDGTRIEDLRMQSCKSLLCASLLCMFAAVPIMRLRAELLEKESRARWPVRVDVPNVGSESTSEPCSPCSQVLTTVQWQTLWMAIEREQSLPVEPPTCSWALRALAKLGGWGDTKRNGRPGYPALWKGWDRLLERVDAVLLMSATHTSQ